MLAILKTPADVRTESQRAEVARYYLAEVAPEFKPARDRLAALKKQLAEMKPETSVPILRELAAGARRKTQIQRRGNFMDLGDEVTEGVPEAIYPLPANVDVAGGVRHLAHERLPLVAEEGQQGGPLVLDEARRLLIGHAAS